MTNLQKENGTMQAEENVLHIPATEPKVIPGSPERMVELPIYLKNGKYYSRIDSAKKGIRIWSPENFNEICVSDTGLFANDFLRAPQDFEVITEEQFNEAFTSALSAICTAHGLDNTVTVENTALPAPNPVEKMSADAFKKVFEYCLANGMKADKDTGLQDVISFIKQLVFNQSEPDEQPDFTTSTDETKEKANQRWQSTQESLHTDPNAHV